MNMTRVMLFNFLKVRMYHGALSHTLSGRFTRPTMRYSGIDIALDINILTPLSEVSTGFDSYYTFSLREITSTKDFNGHLLHSSAYRGGLTGYTPYTTPDTPISRRIFDQLNDSISIHQVSKAVKKKQEFTAEILKQ